MPLSPHGHSAALVSGRYAYLGPVVSSLSSDTQLGYWDYQVSAQYELGTADRVGLLVLGASDEIHTSAYDNEVRFHRIDPRYEHDFSDDTRGFFALTLGTGFTSAGSILIGHELGHKQNLPDRIAAQVVMGLVGYGHFRVEHNRGHHVHVATPEELCRRYAAGRFSPSLPGIPLRSTPDSSQVVATQPQ